MASNFPTAYVRVASQTYVLQHISIYLFYSTMLDIIYVCWCMCISIAAAAVLWLLLKVIESITFRGNILHLPSAHHLPL